MECSDEWLEYDHNPFILFDRNGKVLTLNNEAQYLLGDVPAKEVFDLTLSYATHTYGFNTTIVDIEFKNYKFYALTVGYKDDEVIGIKLYKYPEKKYQKLNDGGVLVNIYSLLDMCMSANSTASDIEYVKEFDPTFPDIKLNVDEYVKIISYILSKLSHKQRIDVKMYLKVGEFLRVEGKKYNIFVLQFSCDETMFIESSILNLSEKINCTIVQKKRSIQISSPMILGHLS
jgi:hypothetical protein